ncbi:MAG: hypothetical protein UZ11_BCD004000593 [Bacteroidetes bacterium OLB11]|nr:MAG: hypothetical protein UZ11_BCD004000593 [Bacteroidetes bacterium OLB11]
MKSLFQLNENLVVFFFIKFIKPLIKEAFFIFRITHKLDFKGYLCTLLYFKTKRKLCYLQIIYPYHTAKEFYLTKSVSILQKGTAMELSVQTEPGKVLF